MKIITKVVAIIAASLLCTQLNAQSFGIKGGLNMSKPMLKVNGDKYDSDAQKFKPGVHIGGFYSMPLADAIDLEVSGLISTKGSKIKDDNIKMTTNIVYLEIPILAKYNLELSKGNSLFIGAGPYAGIGLAGKTKVSFIGFSDSKSLDFGNDDDSDIKRLDLGLATALGFNLDGIIIGLGYDFGLTNNAPKGDSDNKTSTRTFKLSFGYTLGK